MKPGGGICVYVRNNLETECFEHMDASNSDLELKVVSVSGLNHRRVNILTIYRPPSGNYANALSQLADLMLLIE